MEYRVTIEEVRRLVDRARLFLEKILELDPEIKNKLCRDGYNLVYNKHLFDYVAYVTELSPYITNLW